MKIMHSRPSVGLVVALLALFVALGGTAGAVVTASVPLAKRALVADNAKKLNGLSAVQIGAAALKASQVPGPASTAAGLVTTTTAPYMLSPGAKQAVTVSCSSAGKALGAGFDNPTTALVVSTGSLPSQDPASWIVDLINLSDSTSAHGVVIVTCIK